MIGTVSRTITPIQRISGTARPPWVGGSSWSLAPLGPLRRLIASPASLAGIVITSRTVPAAATTAVGRQECVGIRHHLSCLQQDGTACPAA